MKYATLSETALYVRLREGFADSDDADVADLLRADVLRVCGEAAERMKRMQALHEQFTLHDDVHLRRVTALMALVMPEEVLDGLNPIEVVLLILAAHLHDQGMIPERKQLDRIRTGADEELRDFERRWSIDNPKLRKVQEALRDDTLREEQKERYRIVERQLRDLMITDFIRRGHGRRSAEYVRERYSGGDVLAVEGVDLTPLLARLCDSHERPVAWISEKNGFGVDERVNGYDVNLHYLAFVLRLADILDFDRDRVPQALYENISFTSDVSLREWEKHRSVRDWKIEPKLIQFTAECEHPAYQNALDDYMNWIDRELEGARSAVAGYGDGIRKRYHFGNLPPFVDRKRIGPKDGAYIYRDVEFSLSRDDIVQLLMTNKLYRDPSLCVRELLQNSLDALRHRVALYKRDGAALDPTGVYLEHKLDEDENEVLVCRDDGVGMDVGIVENFLTKVGRSYYRSPAFAWERERLRDASEDFDPCARFGIGFMSCFMLGDKIRIRTRRDGGPSEGRGDPLEVEIDGLGGMLVIRKGPDGMLPGTEVEVTVREKPLVYDKNTDQVKLTEVVDGYAVACEFPIAARCTIPGIAAEARPPVGVYEKPTDMERVKLESSETLEQDFSEIDERLRDKVRVSFLKGEDGNLAVENEEARWVGEEEGGGGDNMLMVNRKEGWREGRWNQERLRMMDSTYTRGHVCLDGIVVSGALRTPTGYGKKLPADPDPIRLGRSFFTLDVRGDAKPPLTPARTPDTSLAGEHSYLGRNIGGHPGWLRLERLASLAGGRLWEKVVERCSGKPEVFWQLAALHEGIHRAHYSGTGSLLLWMRAEHIWEHLYYPVGADGGGVEWRRPSELGRLFSIFPPEREYVDDDGETYLDTERPYLDPEDRRRIQAPQSVERWLRQDYVSYGDDEPEEGSDRGWDDYTFLDPLLALSELTLDGGWPVVVVREPTDPELVPGEFSLLNLLGGQDTPIVMPYSGDLRGVLAASFVRDSLNRDHPLVRLAVAAQYKERLNDVERFAEELVRHAAGTGDFYEAVARGYPVAQDWLRYLGAMFRAVDWSSVDEDYHPPYRLWSRKGGFDSLTEERFIEWSNFTPRYIR